MLFWGSGGAYSESDGQPGDLHRPGGRAYVSPPGLFNHRRRGLWPACGTHKNCERGAPPQLPSCPRTFSPPPGRRWPPEVAPLPAWRRRSGAGRPAPCAWPCRSAAAGAGGNGEQQRQGRAGLRKWALWAGVTGSLGCVRAIRPPWSCTQIGRMAVLTCIAQKGGARRRASSVTNRPLSSSS